MIKSITEGATVGQVIDTIKQMQDQGRWACNSVAEALEWLKAYDIHAPAKSIQAGCRSEWAYYWAYDFTADKDHMRKFVTEPEWAYWWARDFTEDKGRMRKFVTAKEWAYWWADKFPQDRELMRKLAAAKEAIAGWVSTRQARL